MQLSACTNLVGSVVHKLGVSRHLVDISLQVATLNVSHLKAPVEGLALSLVVADKVELLGPGGRLQGVGQRLDLLPGRLSAIYVEGADVCAGEQVSYSMDIWVFISLQEVPLLVVANCLLSPTRLRVTFASCESTDTSEPTSLRRHDVSKSAIL